MRYAIGLVMLLVLAGCWAKDTACAVLKTAADVCAVLEYVGEDGKTYRVKVTRDQLERLALEASQKEGLPSPQGVQGTAAPKMEPLPVGAPPAPPAPPAPAPSASAPAPAPAPAVSK